MLAYKHSGFSVDTSVRIEAHDRAGLERLLRYCARPAFSMQRLRKAGKDLVYRWAGRIPVCSGACLSRKLPWACSRCGCSHAGSGSR
jgi:hypothetical protein